MIHLVLQERFSEDLTSCHEFLGRAAALEDTVKDETQILNLKFFQAEVGP